METVGVGQSELDIARAADSTVVILVPESGDSIQTLKARWSGTRSAHPQLFVGLQAVATLKEIPRSKRAELRLVVGPLPSPEAAVELCATLASFRVSCQPTNFDGQHLALQ